MRNPTKLMIKVKGLEIVDMKKFLGARRKERAALVEVKNNSKSAELHTQQKFCQVERAQRTEGMEGRNEPEPMGNSATNGD